MVLRLDPSGSIAGMQSPLSSRRNIRPERVAPDEAFVLVAWRTVMVCPFVSQLRLDPLRSPAGAGGFQAQRMSHFLFFGLQVGERMRRRADLAGKAFDDLDAALAERAHLAWVIGQQANARNAKVVEDRGGQAEVPEVGLEPERMIGLDRVDSGVLQLVSLQLGHQADAAPFLKVIDHQSAAFLRDRLYGELELAAAIATLRAEHFAGQALRVDTQERHPLAQVAEHEGDRGFDGSTAGPPAAFESHRFEHAPFGRQAGGRDPPQRAGLRRCSRSVFVCGHWPRTSLAPARTYSAATGVVVFVTLGGRFSRNADSASLASAERTRSLNAWFSMFTASLSWPIEACLMSRLHARNAPLGFAVSFCAIAVAVASRSRSGTTRVTRPSSAARVAVKGSPSKINSAARRCPTRSGTEKLDPNSGTRPRLTKGIWNCALSPA